MTGSQRFYDLLHEIAALHAKKQKDYGTDADPFANVRGSKEWGIPPWVGAMVRATDKLKRLQKFATVGSLANESVVDSFQDLAVYALIALILYEEETEDQIDYGDDYDYDPITRTYHIHGNDCDHLLDDTCEPDRTSFFDPIDPYDPEVDLPIQFFPSQSLVETP
jgi:hypothetical protein